MPKIDLRPLQPNPQDESTMLVPLTDGTFAVIAKEYADAVGKYNWSSNRGYPGNTEVGSLISFIESLEIPASLSEEDIRLAESVARFFRTDWNAVIDSIPTIPDSEEINDGTDSFLYRNHTNSTILAESIPNAVDSISDHEILSK